MDASAMFHITYGLYLIGVECDGKKNACIINTPVQTTAEPIGMSFTMLKTNYTTELIRKKSSLTISVLSLECSLDMISNFGSRSGRAIDKFEGVGYEVDGYGNPYIAENMIAYMSLKVTSVIDLDTHYLFICNVEEAEKLQTGKPMTYTDYRILKSGGNIETSENSSINITYVCSVCHYVYDGDIPFADLPDDYICPVCKKPKSVFVEQ